MRWNRLAKATSFLTTSFSGGFSREEFPDIPKFRLSIFWWRSLRAGRNHAIWQIELLRRSPCPLAQDRTSERKRIKCIAESSGSWISTQGEPAQRAAGRRHEAARRESPHARSERVID